MTVIIEGCTVATTQCYMSKPTIEWLNKVSHFLVKILSGPIKYSGLLQHNLTEVTLTSFA